MLRAAAVDARKSSVMKDPANYTAARRSTHTNATAAAATTAASDTLNSSTSGSSSAVPGRRSLRQAGGAKAEPLAVMRKGNSRTGSMLLRVQPPLSRGATNTLLNISEGTESSEKRSSASRAQEAAVSAAAVATTPAASETAVATGSTTSSSSRRQSQAAVLSDAAQATSADTAAAAAAATTAAAAAGVHDEHEQDAARGASDTDSNDGSDDVSDDDASEDESDTVALTAAATPVTPPLLAAAPSGTVYSDSDSAAAAADIVLAETPAQAVDELQDSIEEQATVPPSTAAEAVDDAANQLKGSRDSSERDSSQQSEELAVESDEALQDTAAAVTTAAVTAEPELTALLTDAAETSHSDGDDSSSIVAPRRQPSDSVSDNSTTEAVAAVPTDLIESDQRVEAVPAVQAAAAAGTDGDTATASDSEVAVSRQATTDATDVVVAAAELQTLATEPAVEAASVAASAVVKDVDAAVAEVHTVAATPTVAPGFTDAKRASVDTAAVVQQQLATRESLTSTGAPTADVTVSVPLSPAAVTPATAAAAAVPIAAAVAVADTPTVVVPTQPTVAAASAAAAVAKPAAKMKAASVTSPAPASPRTPAVRRATNSTGPIHIVVDVPAPQREQTATPAVAAVAVAAAVALVKRTSAGTEAAPETDRPPVSSGSRSSISSESASAPATARAQSPRTVLSRRASPTAAQFLLEVPDAPLPTAVTTSAQQSREHVEPWQGLDAWNLEPSDDSLLALTQVAGRCRLARRSIAAATAELSAQQPVVAATDNAAAADIAENVSRPVSSRSSISGTVIVTTSREVAALIEQAELLSQHETVVLNAMAAYGVGPAAGLLAEITRTLTPTAAAATIAATTVRQPSDASSVTGSISVGSPRSGSAPDAKQQRRTRELHAQAEALKDVVSLCGGWKVSSVHTYTVTLLLCYTAGVTHDVYSDYYCMFTCAIE
jgi:trimeric autotransporter adhesin